MDAISYNPSVFFVALAFLLLALLFSTFKILREYERGVIFMLGRFYQVKGPGLIIVIPFVQQMVRVDLRTVVMDVPTQDVISRDNVSVKVNAVLYFRVIDAQKAIINVEDYLQATSQLAQTTLRSVLGQHELDEMLANREMLNTDIQSILDSRTDGWGIKVSNVEIKHVDLNETMVRAIARQAEAERTRRAKVIHASGEMEASAKLVTAAQTLAKEPNAILLRYLQTLTEIAGEKNSTILFPLPMNLLNGVMDQTLSDEVSAATGKAATSHHSGTSSDLNNKVSSDASYDAVNEDRDDITPNEDDLVRSGRAVQSVEEQSKPD